MTNVTTNPACQCNDCRCQNCACTREAPQCGCETSCRCGCQCSGQCGCQAK